MRLHRGQGHQRGDQHPPQGVDWQPRSRKGRIACRMSGQARTWADYSIIQTESNCPSQDKSVGDTIFALFPTQFVREDGIEDAQHVIRDF